MPFTGSGFADVLTSIVRGTRTRTGTEVPVSTVTFVPSIVFVPCDVTILEGDFRHSGRDGHALATSPYSRWCLM